MKAFQKVLVGSMIAGAGLAVIRNQEIESEKEKSMPKIVDTLITQLDHAAQTSSDFQKQSAESKSLRQSGNTEGRTDLYMWLMPDQTLEGRASDCIKGIKEALEETMKRYPDSHAGLTFFAVASGLLAGTVEEVHMAWAKSVIDNKES